MIVTKLGEKYGIINLENQEVVLKYIYDDLYIFNDIFVTIKDNELNILDSSQKKYTNNIRVDNINNVALELKDNILNIKINNENEFSEYKFDLKTKKLT